MSDRLPRWLREGLSRARERATERLASWPAAARLLETIDDVRHTRLGVSHEALSRHVAHVADVASATVIARDGVLRVDVSFDAGTALRARLHPLRATFAPGGAKELAFRVDPPGAAEDPRIASVVGAIGEAVARALWGPLTRVADAPLAGGLAERDADVVRIDLRTVPTARAIARLGALAPLLELVEVRTVVAERDALRLELGLTTALRR